MYRAQSCIYLSDNSRAQITPLSIVRPPRTIRRKEQSRFLFPLSRPNFINTVYTLRISVYAHSRLSVWKAHTYACAHARSHVLAFAWVLVRGMKRDSVAEEGKERAAGERLGGVVCGVGVSVSVPSSLSCPHPPFSPLSQRIPVAASAPPKCRRLAAATATVPPHAAWRNRWSAARGMAVDQYCGGSRGCLDERGTRIRRAGVDLRKGTPYANLFPSSSLLVFVFFDRTPRIMINTQLSNCEKTLFIRGREINNFIVFGGKIVFLSALGKKKKLSHKLTSERNTFLYFYA